MTEDEQAEMEALIVALKELNDTVKTLIELIQRLLPGGPGGWGFA
jgi:ribonuclease HI